MGRLELRLLGGLELQLSGKNLSQLKSQKGKALLCYLAVTGKSVNRTILASLLWSDMPESQALMNLRKTLFRLKPLADYLLTTRETVAFIGQTAYALDVDEFEMLVDNQEDTGHLQKAVSLYRGDFLDGFYVWAAPLFEEWMLAERARLREKYLDSLQTLVNRFEIGRDYANALSYSDRLVNEEPLREDLQRGRLRLLALNNRRSEALAAYENLVALLAQELGVDPEPATTREYEEIKAGKWVPEVDAEVGPAEGQIPKHNLPAQMTPFIGRTEELATLKQFLSDSNIRLINISGPGGIGKTRLALAAAEAELANGQRWANGIYFVPLAGVEAVDSLPQTVGEAIGFPFSGAERPQVQLQHYLRRKQMLLVLDNFEHLLAGVKMVEALLTTAAGVKLLVTSREKLNLQGEHLLPIGGLRMTPEAEDAASDWMDLPAIELFVERARSVRPSFQVTAANYPSVAAICRQVEGVPLGIVLAAAWIDTLTVEEITLEIKEDLDFLATTMDDVPLRQRSLRAAFNHSWRMLNRHEQEIYSQLSIFHGGFTAAAAGYVAGASLHDLQVLVNQSLLTRVPAREGKIGRFEIHELLRQFAAQELSMNPDCYRAARTRHRDYFLSLLHRYESSWTSWEQLEAKSVISRESDNIKAAWHHALVNSSWDRLAEAIDSWATYHYWQGLYGDGNAFCAALEEHLRSTVANQKAASPIMGMLLVKAVAWQGKYLQSIEEGMAKLQESLELLERLETDSPQMMRLKAFILIAMAWRILPQEKMASHRLAEQALQLSLQVGDRGETAEIYSCLGLLANQLARPVEAEKYMVSALSLFDALGDRRNQFWPIVELAGLSVFKGDTEKAVRLSYEAFELCKLVGDLPLLAHCYTALAAYLECNGQLEEALAKADKAAALCVEYGLREIEGLARWRLAKSLMHMGFYSRSREELAKALKVAEKTGNTDVQFWIWVTRGDLALVAAEGPEAADTYFARSFQLAAQAQLETEGARQWSGLVIACRAGDGDRAHGYAVDLLAFNLRRRDAFALHTALAAFAYYLACFGSQTRAVELWYLASRHPYIANSQWYADIAGNTIKAVARDMAPEVIEGISSRAGESNIWETAEALLTELEQEGD